MSNTADFLIGLVSLAGNEHDVAGSGTQDRPLDRTTAVALGVTRTLVLARVLLAVSAVYGALVVSPWLAALPALAIVIPLDRARVSRTWDQLRVVLGVAFLGAVAWVWWMGETAGVLVQVSRGMALW